MKTKETSVKQRLYNKKYNSYAEWNGSAWEDKSIAGAYFHSMEKANANGWFEETSTREQALAWWSNLPFNSSNNVSKTSYCKKYYGNFTLSRTYDTLTDKEIEKIWRKETKEGSDREIIEEVFPDLKPNQEELVTNDNEIVPDYSQPKSYLEEKLEKIDKTNQKQYSQEEVDKLLDQQAARTAAQIIESNQKQFKQFNESLFKAYISKFSDEDKLKAFNILNEEFAYYSHEQMELVQKQHDEQVKFLQNKILELSK